MTISWGYASQDPIEVAQVGPLHRARVQMPLCVGSPYRSLFTRDKVVVAWGWSSEGAARRCSARRRRVFEKDQQAWRDRQANTRTYSDRDL